MDLSFPDAGASLDQHWQDYINTGSSAFSQVRQVILRSWQRCSEKGVDPLNDNLHDHLKGGKLTEALHHRQCLISVAHPFMTDLYTLVKGSGFVVVLTNEDGYILELFGDEGAGETPMTGNFFIGASWHEKDAGTNAIGTAIEEQKPVQVSGPEHYCRKHHCLTCSAAPIFDPEDRLIGILDISGAYESAHLHTLGMVVAAAKAIIAQLRIRLKNHQLPGEIVNRENGISPPLATTPPPANRQQRMLQQKERDKHHLEHLLNIHAGNITEVARELGVSRKTVYNRMHRLAIAN